MKPCLLFNDRARTHLMLVGEKGAEMMMYVSACGDAMSAVTRFGFPTEVDCVNCRKSAVFHEAVGSGSSTSTSPSSAPSPTT